MRQARGRTFIISKQFGGSNKLPLQKISYSPGTLESGKVVDRWMVPDDGWQAEEFVMQTGNRGDKLEQQTVKETSSSNINVSIIKHSRTKIVLYCYSNNVSLRLDIIHGDKL